MAEEKGEMRAEETWIGGEVEKPVPQEPEAFITGSSVVEAKEMPVPQKPKAFFTGSSVVVRNEVEVVHNRVSYGTEQLDGTLSLSPLETIFLLERGRIELFDEQTGEQKTNEEKPGEEKAKEEKLDLYQYLQKVSSSQPELWTRYLVYRDLRSRGYIVKEGLSEDIIFRVYPRVPK